MIKQLLGEDFWSNESELKELLSKVVTVDQAATLLGSAKVSNEFFANSLIEALLNYFFYANMDVFVNDLSKITVSPPTNEQKAFLMGMSSGRTMRSSFYLPSINPSPQLEKSLFDLTVHSMREVRLAVLSRCDHLDLSKQGKRTLLQVKSSSNVRIIFMFLLYIRFKNNKLASKPALKEMESEILRAV